MLRRSVSFVSLFLSILTLSLGAETLPTYVVTANRAEEDPMAIPDQVTVITADEIKASGKTKLVDVLSSIPGVSFKSYSTGAEAQVSMRGFGENSYGRVQVLVDGRSLNNPDMSGLNWQSIPLSSIERIEVLDGPAAVPYGSGAIGGVINIITKESSPGVTADATLVYGSHTTEQALLNAGYAADSAGVLVSADIYRTKGFRDRTENKNTNVTVNSFVDVTDKLTLKPFLSFSDIYYQLPGGLTEKQFNDDPTQAANDSDAGTEKDVGVGVSALFAASGRLSIELPVNYNHKDRAVDTVSWGSWTDVTQHTFGVKPKASYEGDAKYGPYRITGGFDFGGALHDATGYSDKNRSVETYTFDISQFTYAPWVSTTVSLPRKFSLTTGARYDAETISATKDKAKLTSSTIGKLDKSDAASALVYDIALGYRPTDELSLYAKYNTLFRYPFIDEKAELYGTNSDGDYFNADLVPETGRNFEVGAKYSFGTTLSAFCNAYYLLMNDEIAYNNVHNENLAETTRLGGSAGVTIKPVKFVTFDVNGSYVHAVISNGAHDGDPIALVPALTANADATVVLPLGMTLGTDVSYTGERTYNYGDDSLDPYVLVGLTFRLSPPIFKDKLAFTVRGDNILDTHYASYVYSAYAFYPAEGRSFTVSAAYRY